MFEELEGRDVAEADLRIVEAGDVVGGSSGEELVAECGVNVACGAIGGSVIGVDGDVVVDNGGGCASFMDRVSGRIDWISVSDIGDSCVVVVVFEKEEVTVVAAADWRVDREGIGVELDLRFVDGAPGWRDAESGDSADGWMREEGGDVFDGELTCHGEC